MVVQGFRVNGAAYIGGDRNRYGVSLMYGVYRIFLVKKKFFGRFKNLNLKRYKPRGLVQIKNSEALN